MIQADLLKPPTRKGIYTTKRIHGNDIFMNVVCLRRVSMDSKPYEKPRFREYNCYFVQPPNNQIQDEYLFCLNVVCLS